LNPIENKTASKRGSKCEKTKFGSSLKWLNNRNYLTLELSTKNKAQNYTKWVLDSGAMDYMISNQTLTLLKNYLTIISGQYFMVSNNE
jgi:hypothetical protein